MTIIDEQRAIRRERRRKEEFMTDEEKAILLEMRIAIRKEKSRKRDLKEIRDRKRLYIDRSTKKVKQKYYAKFKRIDGVLHGYYEESFSMNYSKEFVRIWDKPIAVGVGEFLVRVGKHHKDIQFMQQINDPKFITHKCSYRNHPFKEL